ncbi:MAG: hypothetical protein ACLFUZ_01960 [Candidatus Micrarchaeia archaeon]
MKGQIVAEELFSVLIYLAMLSLLLSGLFVLKDSGSAWSEEISLRSEAGSLARMEDAFHSNNLYNPHNWSGGGEGYVQLEKGDAAYPVVWGKLEVAKGEPV